MSNVLSLTRSDPAVRWLIQRDLPAVVEIERQTAGYGWTEEDFRTALRSIRTVGQVAEVNDEVVGFVVYNIARQRRQVEEYAGSEARGPSTARQTRGILCPPVQIDLLNIGVAPAWQRRGIGRALLGRLEQKIERGGGCLRAVVPEINLAVQLFLRQGGYKAVRILRGHFGDRDGYLMARRQARPSR
ncbi:MAG TPA: GNAT family N-acetyltransferase, partial [Gemmataceae bacterium]|nr:GNAT family N-acetyltransferase [Gemmataceae bacterium]